MKFRGKRIGIGLAATALLGGGLTLLGGNAQANTLDTIRSGDFIPSLSATRANGVVTVGDNGLGLATWAPAAPTSPSPDKAAEYWNGNFDLDTVNGGSMVVRGGPQKPGINLYVDMDDDDATHMAGADGYKGADAILVGEAVYGDDWWMPEGTATTAVKSVVNADPSMKTGGSGSTSHGTMAKWNSTFNKAHVEAVGFSLGSGSGNTGVVVTKLTVGTHDYAFAGKDSVVPPTHVTDAPANVHVTTTTTGNVSLAWDAVAGAKNYRVYRTDLTNNVGSSTDANITVDGLKPNKSYGFQVAAAGEDGQYGAKSAVVTGTTKTVTLGTPTGLTASNVTRTTALIKANNVPFAESYRFYVKCGKETVRRPNGVADNATTGYVIQGLPAGTKCAVSMAADTTTTAPGPQSAGVTFTTLK